MNAQEFVSALHSEVADAAVVGTFLLLEDPPGRKPDAKLVELSQWYRGLGERDRVMLRRVVAMSVDDCAFGLLAVLDGSRSVTDDPGDFELTFRSGESTDILCGPRGAVLHELY